MTAEYGAYRAEVVASPLLPREWMRDVMGQAVDALWEEDVVVDYVWIVVSSYPWAFIHAIVYDEEDEPWEAIIECEFDQSTRSQPFGKHWVLVSIEMDELPEGLLGT